ncbi:unnamed protein product [Somion occarium]|uniref:Uncharacterized protein n=1 Tax=Somion occarium TaxID=3059160 RepID=A0ABP1D5C6_9APHY
MVVTSTEVCTPMTFGLTKPDAWVSIPGIFKPAFPCAKLKNLRIISLNKRDYSSSTPYSEEELAELNSPDEAIRIGFVKKRVAEVGAFIVWLIQNENIPTPVGGSVDDSKEKGGLSIAAWSSGSCLAVPFLAFAPELIGKDSLDLIQKYLCSYVMYDAPNFPHGLPVPVLDGQYYCPIGDPALTHAEIIQQFPDWCSGFYTHSPSALSELSAPLDAPSNFSNVTEFLSALTLNQDVEPAPTSIQILQAASDTCEPVPNVARAHVQLLFVSFPFYAECSAKVFLSPMPIWPKVRREVVVCGRSFGLTLYAAWELKRLVQFRKSLIEGKGKEGCTVRFHVWKDFNHTVRLHSCS